MGVILVVDDEPHATRVLKTHLERAGHQVQVASNGEDALQKLGEIEFDVLITDICMPRMGGRELCERVRAANVEPEPLIFVLSSSAEAEHRVWTRDFLNVEFIEKPVSLKRLVERVAELLAKPDASEDSGA
ncbi:MAG: response regulator [Myxococcales bacterium]|nr:response regulator [Myxococcales bacterium]